MGLFLGDVKEVEDMVVSTRRTIHQNPELSFREEKTAKLVSEVLRSLDVKVKTKVGGNGVLGLLEGAKPGRVVALRADMDALPLDEMSDVDFRSKVKGVMHACGHDAHVAMLLGAAMLLSKHRDELESHSRKDDRPGRTARGISVYHPLRHQEQYHSC